jgi:hypothetical protein
MFFTLPRSVWIRLPLCLVVASCLLSTHAYSGDNSASGKRVISVACKNAAPKVEMSYGALTHAFFSEYVDGRRRGKLYGARLLGKVTKEMVMSPTVTMRIVIDEQEDAGLLRLLAQGSQVGLTCWGQLDSRGCGTTLRQDVPPKPGKHH